MLLRCRRQSGAGDGDSDTQQLRHERIGAHWTKLYSRLLDAFRNVGDAAMPLGRAARICPAAVLMFSSRACARWRRIGSSGDYLAEAHGRTPNTRAAPTARARWLPTDRVCAERLRETHFWLRYRLARLALDSAVAEGAPTVCIDVDAGSGLLCDEVDGDLSWGASLLALQLLAPDEIYVLHAATPEKACTLASRAEQVKPSGGMVYEISIDGREAYARARDIARVKLPFGPKVIISHGDPARLVLALNELLARSPRRPVDCSNWPSCSTPMANTRRFS